MVIGAASPKKLDRPKGHRTFAVFIRTVDKTRLVKPLGQISPDEQSLVLETLAEMFAE